MNDILQYKVLSNKIKEALNEKVIGDVHVEYTFEPSVFGMVIKIAIDDPFKKQVPYYNDSSWYYSVTLDEYTVNCSIYDEEGTLELLSEIVNGILTKYKEHVYKRYFFD